LCTIQSRRESIELIYETTISTFENPPQTAAWLPCAQSQQERSGYFAQSAQDWAEAPDARIRNQGMAARQLPRLRFARAARIKQGRDFARVRQAGERMTVGCLIANWQRLPAGAPSRLGVVTAGRIGGAVVRSRARRLLRESFRVHQHDLAAPVDLVLVARPSIVGRGFAEVERDFLITLKKAKLLKPAERGGV
jgi:ribonuclease P protein component